MKVNIPKNLALGFAFRNNKLYTLLEIKQEATAINARKRINTGGKITWVCLVLNINYFFQQKQFLQTSMPNVGFIAQLC